MGIKADDSRLLTLCNTILVGIIEIESKPIHYGDNRSHTSRWQTDQQYATIDQYIMNEHVKHSAMPKRFKITPKEWSVKSLISICSVARRSSNCPTIADWA